MLEFDYIDEKNILTIEYTPDKGRGIGWVSRKFNEGQEICINGSFHFVKEDLCNPIESIEDDNVIFIFATQHDEQYFKINKEVLSIANDLLVYKDIIRDRRRFKPNLFVASKKTNIMRNIENVTKAQVIIGGELDNAISLELLVALRKKFPNDYELKKYVNSRVYGVLKDNLNISDQPEIDYLNYLKRKNSEIRHNPEMRSNISDVEVKKYQYLHDELVVMLQGVNGYNEATWQNKIMNLLLLLYPKYLYVYQNIKIKDYVLDPTKGTNRFLDYLLVDFDGNVDIIEVKQPFDTCLLTKSVYRDNHVPLKELSGSIMQVEKYIFHLLRMGKIGENAITKQINDKHSNQLARAGINLKIVNPKGIIIMGRDSELSSEQKFDFEIIKRKYKNIVDILTYDDLLRRLNSLISKFSAVESR